MSNVSISRSNDVDPTYCTLKKFHQVMVAIKDAHILVHVYVRVSLKNKADRQETTDYDDD